MSETTVIAIVEDDAAIRGLVIKLFETEGYDAVPCRDGVELDRMLQRRRVDLVLLDRMLPGEDGLSICRRLRVSWPHLPILMVTARGEDVDRIIGLEIGADDYLAKPFNPQELVARARAVLRRASPGRGAPAAPPEQLVFLGWTFDLNARELVSPEGERVELTAGEFELLRVFVTHPQRVLNRDQLMDWTRGRDASPFDRTIDVQLSRLRRKLDDDPTAPRFIRTVRGGGYAFAPAVSRL